MLHLKDVKGLFRLDLWVLLGTAVFIITYSIWNIVRSDAHRQKLAKSTLIGAGLTLGLMIVLGVGMLFDFDDLLWRFHLLSFSNNLWLLDPDKDYLIMLVTNGFMYDASFIVAGVTVMGALIVGGLSGGYLFRLHRQGKLLR